MAKGMYWTCSYGANHDPGERCDCEDEAEQRQVEFAKMVNVERKTNQLRFNFGTEDKLDKKVIC